MAFKPFPRRSPDVPGLWGPPNSPSIRPTSFPEASRATRAIAGGSHQTLKEKQLQTKRYDSGKRMSQAVVHGGFAFLAGQVADDTTQDVKGQTAQILDKIDRLLAKV